MAHGCRLYYITDRTAFGADEPTRRRRLLERVFEAASAGVDYIQLREKELPTRELESLSRDAVAILNKLRTEHGELRTKLLINSRTDVALAMGADGVHLRSDDISPREVRAIWEKSHVGTAAFGCPTARSTAATAGQSKELSPRPLIGVSCHSPAEARQAEANGATFAVFAPVFEKKDFPAAKAAGLMQLREACTVKIPVLALGGVTLENAQFCLESGASGIAAIRLFQENDVATIVSNLRQLFR